MLNRFFVNEFVIISVLKDFRFCMIQSEILQSLQRRVPPPIGGIFLDTKALWQTSKESCLRAACILEEFLKCFLVLCYTLYF